MGTRSETSFVRIRFTNDAWSSRGIRELRIVHLVGSLTGRYYAGEAERRLNGRLESCEPNYQDGALVLGIRDLEPRDLFPLRNWPGIDPDSVVVLVMEQALCA